MWRTKNWNISGYLLTSLVSGWLVDQIGRKFLTQGNFRCRKNVNFKTTEALILKGSIEARGYGYVGIVLSKCDKKVTKREGVKIDSLHFINQVITMDSTESISISDVIHALVNQMEASIPSTSGGGGALSTVSTVSTVLQAPTPQFRFQRRSSNTNNNSNQATTTLPAVPLASSSPEPGPLLAPPNEEIPDNLSPWIMEEDGPPPPPPLPRFKVIINIFKYLSTPDLDDKY